MGTWAAAWGILGVSALLGWAIARLGLVAGRALSAPLTAGQWAALVAVVLAMAFFEGYRGFQQSFSPRCAARARHLALNPTPVRAVLAPLFCMGFIGASRARRVAMVVLTAAITIMVALVSRLSQPWRGIVDAGVVVGLTWGVVTLWIYTARAFSARGLEFPADVVP
jgi:hypothetical protein